MTGDASTWNHQPAARRDPPAPKLEAILFRLVGKSDRPIRCATYQVATGIELRIAYEDDEDSPFRTQLFRRHQETAIPKVATAWRAAFDEIGTYRDITTDSPE